ncbi:MAG TPA: tryptophan synthase subunit alpha [bacterium]|nr:tryptophan synthase subunit alpha [bacterium]
MNRIDQKFIELKKAKKAGFIPYVTAGDPDPKTSERIILALANAGADVIEVGIPFSDPLADGPIIQAAMQRALEAGMTVGKTLSLIAHVRAQTQTPIVLFSYLNPILKYGMKRFANDAAAAGADGVLALDMPPEESAEYVRIMKKHGLSTVFLVAPTSTDARVRRIARLSSGFIYCVSRTGVTGLTKGKFDEVERTVARIREHSAAPVAVGFGVSHRDDVRQIGRLADAVVVGSAIVRTAAEHRDDPVPHIQRFVKGLIHEKK